MPDANQEDSASSRKRERSAISTPPPGSGKGKGKGKPRDISAASGKGKPREFSSCRPTQRQKELNIRLCRSGPTEIETLVLEQADEMNSVNCATALHGLAKAVSMTTSATKSRTTDARERLAERTAAALVQEEKVTSRSLTSIMWAVGKLRLTTPRLISVTTMHASAHLTKGTLDAFGIANVAWALANLHLSATSASQETVRVAEEHAGLLDALAQRACEAPADFKPQELCNLLWAFATLKCRHAALVAPPLEPTTTPRPNPIAI